MSPAVKAELDRIREAAEYAASHPVEGGLKIGTIRGYIRSGGRWYVEALEQDNPDPLPLDGLKLVQAVEEAKLREHFNQPATSDDPYGEASSVADNPVGSYEVAISRKGVSVTVSPSKNKAGERHPVSTGKDCEGSEEA
jgi:hypothetical protein